MNAPIVYPKLSPQELAKRWNALLGSPGLPERYELDEYGEVIETIAPKTACSPKRTRSASSTKTSPRIWGPARARSSWSS